MEDKEFLNWIADRLEGEFEVSPNVDYLLRLRQIAKDGTKHEHNRYLCDDCGDIDDRAYQQGKDFCDD